MASTTPTGTLPGHRPNSRSGNPPSRPTTPLRPHSRNSFRESAASARRRYTADQDDGRGGDDGPLPLEDLEPAFAELSDGMADLEANLVHLQLVHESLARFSESFAAFLYGLNMNAFCVDFPEAPITDSFALAKQHEALRNQASFGRSFGDGGGDVEATFLTTDTSFVDNPPTSSKISSKHSTPAPAPAPTSRIGRGIPTATARGRGGTGRVPTRGTVGRARGSGLARASTRGRPGVR